MSFVDASIKKKEIHNPHNLACDSNRRAWAWTAGKGIWISFRHIPTDTGRVKEYVCKTWKYLLSEFLEIFRPFFYKQRILDKFWCSECAHSIEN